MILTKYIANIFLILLLIIFLCFFYQGVTTSLPVSIDYNIPIAHSIVSGEFFTMQSDNPYMYFPGSSHSFLSMFISFGLPNLFGLFSWIFLFIVCKKLGDTFGLSRYMAIIFAASFCTTMSVVRTIGDQSIDKWLCAWFVFALLLLEKPEKSWKFAILIGLSLGMLIGTKYSGPLFFIALLLVYGKRLFQYLTPLRFAFASLLFTITGLFWYIRNFALQGNPYYPANLPFFKGYPGFTQQDWALWNVFVSYPQGNIDLINAFLSEYLLWAFAGVVLLGFIVYRIKKKEQIEGRIVRLGLLTFTTGLVALLLPITTPYKIELFHIISDMRYVYIFVAVSLLAVFLIAEKYKKDEQLAALALINVIPVFSYIPYLPKIYIISCLVVGFIYFKGKSLLKKIYSL